VVSGQRPSFDSDFLNRCQNWKVLEYDRSHHAATIDFFIDLAHACTVQDQVREHAYVVVRVLVADVA